MEKNNPLISICIPVFQTEPYLQACLDSVVAQDFSSFEVVIVSDASTGKDAKGRCAKKIVRDMQKKCRIVRKSKSLPPVKFHFIENNQNRGLIEVRRTLCTHAKGQYITQLDSDDQLEPGALSALYEASQKGTIDIVHGTSIAGSFDENNNFIPSQMNRYGKILYEQISGQDIFHRWLVNHEFTANTWGKIIRRELFIKAYEHIPYTECNMADDVLLFFFLSQYAVSYVGIKNHVYRYRINTGMSSRRKIDTLHKWKMICSTASVFTIISQWIQENQSEEFSIQSDELETIKAMTRFYLQNNIQQMQEAVIPELRTQAREMLCEYWGADFVRKMENQQ